MPKVLISDNLSQNAVNIFAAHGVETDVKTGLSHSDLQAIIGAYDGLAIRSATKVTEAVLALAPNLKVVVSSPSQVFLCTEKVFLQILHHLGFLFLSKGQQVYP